LGHTVNDLFLAISSAALKRYLEDKGMSPSLPLTATVPVSLQTKDSNKQGNQISYVAVNLRTDIEDPLERLKAIGRSAAAAKNDMSALSRDAVQTLAVVAQSTAAMINQFRLSEFVKPPANLVISNVPGPRDTLYFKGAKLIGYYPLSILMDGQALNITLCSHANQLDFGILGCRSAMPDLESLATYIGDAFEELKAVAQSINPAVVSPAETKKASKKPATTKAAKSVKPKESKVAPAAKKTRAPAKKSLTKANIEAPNVATTEAPVTLDATASPAVAEVTA
jgi:diacylglycerol O-acyltransferase